MCVCACACVCVRARVCVCVCARASTRLAVLAPHEHSRAGSTRSRSRLSLPTQAIRTSWRSHIRTRPRITTDTSREAPPRSCACGMSRRELVTWVPRRTLRGLPQAPFIMRRETLCQTLLGQDCDLITVSDDVRSELTAQNPRRVIVLTARVHPGMCMVPDLSSTPEELTRGMPTQVKPGHRG